MIYVPTHYNRDSPVPLWILAHGNDDTPEIFIKMANMVSMAEKHTFAFAALAAEDGAFNVGLDAREDDPNGPDDVDYTRTVLMEVTRKLNVDMQRIRCAGFSRGGRFCSRLASELSTFITGIAVVSGIRFPKPNNATRPLPVIAFHGTEDPVNPYNGMGQAYWLSSVDDAVQRWADFNGCTQHRWKKVSTQVLKSLHTGCKDGADVVLVQIVRGGHTWPGSWYDFGDLGYVTHEIDASETLREFFVKHPVPEQCNTAVEGDPCYPSVQWARNVGVYKHPHWYGGLTSTSSLDEFQAYLHKHIAANCAMPCPRADGEHDAARPPELANASGAVMAAAVPSALPTTTTQWVTVRWLEEDEEHVAGATAKETPPRDDAVPESPRATQPAGPMQLQGPPDSKVMQRFGASSSALMVCGGFALLAALAAVACRANALTRSKQWQCALLTSRRHFQLARHQSRPLQLLVRADRLSPAPVAEEQLGLE